MQPVGFSGDVGAQVAALMVEDGDDERTAAHAQRDAQERIEQQDDAAQVKTLHDEASSMRVQGGFDGVAAGVTAIAKACSPVAGAAGEGLEKVGDSAFGAYQKDDEASAAGSKAAANQAATAAKDDDDLANDANGDVGAAIDFARNYTQTEAATTQAALHRA